MMNLVISIISLVLLGQVVPVNDRIIFDNIISISCPLQSACFLLDDFGNLLFSSDGGKTIKHRSNLEDHNLKKIIFKSLTNGYALDKKGRIWQSRNGGKSFRATKIKNLQAFADIGQGTHCWAITTDGRLYKLNKQIVQITDAKVDSRSKILGLSVASSGSAAKKADMLVVRSEDSTVFTSHDNGASWNQARPLSGKVLDIAVNQNGWVVAVGCRGEIALSTDAGQSYRTMDYTARPDAWSSVCLKTAGFMKNGKFVILGLPNRVLIGDPSTYLLESIQLPKNRNLNTAAQNGSGLLLAGNSGALVKVGIDKSSKLVFNDLNHTENAIADIETFNQKYVWIAYHGGKLLASKDSGVNWSHLNLPGTQAAKLSFVNSKTGYALLGENQVYQTKDGGISWKKLADWTDLALNDLFFIDHLRGWAVGARGCVVYTEDGGANWTLDGLDTDHTLYKILFVDKKRGWIVGVKQTVFHTSNGGRSWQQMLEGRGNLYSLHFFKSGEGWVAGVDGLVQHTKDGGKTWTPCPLPTSKTVRVISFLDSARGIAGGDKGELYITKSGCSTWIKKNIFTKNPIKVLNCRGPRSMCWIGGDQGLLLSGYPHRYYP
jgi:photosystem II stability/assembly factor-like uncharacterized protein